MSAKFKDYVKEMEATLNDVERVLLDAFRANDRKSLSIYQPELDAFELHAPNAVDSLINLLGSNRATLIALARARLIQGFETFPDGPMFTWEAQRLSGETLEELADAIVYKAFEMAKILEQLQAP
jgi:hypothetical protein